MTEDDIKDLMLSYAIDEGHYNYDTILMIMKVVSSEEYKRGFDDGFDEGYEEHKWLVQKTGATENWGPDV